MRVLQLVESYSAAGGMERFVYNFTRKLEERGMETVLAGFSFEATDSWGSAALETVTLGNEPESWMAMAAAFQPDAVIWHIQGPRSAAVVERLAKRYLVTATVHGVMCPSHSRLFRDRDEICTRASGAGCYPRWYLRKCGTSASPYAAHEAIRTHRVVMDALQACHRVYAVSKAIERFLIIEGVAQSRIAVFDNTLGSIGNLPKVELPAPRVERLKLLCVGRLVYAKGVQYVIRAVGLLKQWGMEAQCSIVGDGWYEEKLMELADSLGISDRIHFVGKVPGSEMDRWYADCDVSIVPSIWPDPSPLVVPEARLAGKPVVVFEAGGLPEWSGYMDGVFVAEHANAESLAETILSVFSPDAEWRGGRRYAEQRADVIADLAALAAAAEAIG